MFHYQMKIDMEKILDSTFREELRAILEEAGVKKKDARNLVANRYKTALKSSVVSHLKKVIDLIERECLVDLRNLISFSPSGDCMGCDNNYLDFSSVCSLQDIGDVVDEIDRCNQIMK